MNRTVRAFRCASVVFFAGIVYVSLLPFEWRVPDAVDAWQALRGLATPLAEPVSRVDVIANVLLFLPFGFVLAGALSSSVRDRHVGWSVLAAIALSAAASAAVEGLQLFVSLRVPSAVDIAAQVVGSVVGVLLWIVSGRAFTAWIVDTWTAGGNDRLPRAVAALAVLWLLAGLAPFDITFDLGELAARWRSGAVNAMPLARHISGLDLLLHVISAIPVGACALMLASRRGRGRAWAVGAAVIAVTARECAQVFVASHTADIDDVWAGTLGSVVGVWLMARWPDAAVSRPTTTGSVSLVRVVLVTAWAALMAAMSWSPYDFSIDGESVRQHLAAMSLVPFSAYLGGSPLAALDDFATTLALSVALGFLCVAGGHNRSTVIVIAVLAAATAFLTVLEFGQLFLPTRTPDPTDVLTGTIGVYLGVRLAGWLRKGTGMRTDPPMGLARRPLS